MAGRTYEAFLAGEVIRHDLRRTVTETDNLLITTLTHNPQPLHLDAEFAKGTEFGRIVVNGLFTFSLMVGVSVGDTLHFETTVIEARPSRSRPNAGVVVFEHRAYNQDDVLVCQGRRTALMRGGGP